MSRAIEWILLGAGSCVAILLGVRWHKPTRTGPWLLLAGSVTMLAAGDVFYSIDATSAADACYLSMFVLVAAALLQFTRGGSLLVDRARLIDLLAFACATLLVVWVFVIGSSGQIGRISAADVIGDLLLVGVAIRLIMAAGRNAAAALLLAGSAGMLAGDVLYPLAPGPLTEGGYVVLYVTWALAALHPSMTRLTRPMQPRPTPWRGRWAALLAASVATPPAVLLIEALSGPVRDGVVIAVAGALTLLLTFTRLADSVTGNSRAAQRERALRAASGALVAAADPPAVARSVRAAIAQLMPAQAVHRVVFAPDDRTLPAEFRPPTPGSTSSPHSHQQNHPPTPGCAPSWRQDKPPTSGERPNPRNRRQDDPPTPAGSSRRHRQRDQPATSGELSNPRSSRQDAPPSPCGPSSRSRRQDDPPTSPRSWWLDEAGENGTLVCPLWLEPMAVARPSGGALVVTGRREILTITRDALEMLAAQATLALDRIALVDAVGRRDSDRYLRAVIGNSPDLMLVIDDDQRIRYASPGFHTLLGGDVSPLATLTDLVHPDDRGQVRRAFRSYGDGTLFCALRRPDDSQVLVEATYRDLREDRLVQGFVLTMREVTATPGQPGQLPHLENVDELPAWVNRRSAQHKFRY